ncbi:hypothetical protein F5X96DRAFT_397456 [Biscogniauxia mediterranea]|nr:hypothetical protein F5X96DRAFT_397456 [Biscogniauxia mediterranea]
MKRLTYTIVTLSLDTTLRTEYISWYWGLSSLRTYTYLLVSDFHLHLHDCTLRISRDATWKMLRVCHRGPAIFWACLTWLLCPEPPHMLVVRSVHDREVPTCIHSWSTLYLVRCSMLPFLEKKSQSMRYLMFHLSPSWSQLPLLFSDKRNYTRREEKKTLSVFFSYTARVK